MQIKFLDVLGHGFVNSYYFRVSPFDLFKHTILCRLNFLYHRCILLYLSSEFQFVVLEFLIEGLDKLIVQGGLGELLFEQGELVVQPLNLHF